MRKLSITKSEMPTGAAPGNATKYLGCSGVGVPSARTCRGLAPTDVTGRVSRGWCARECVRPGSGRSLRRVRADGEGVAIQGGAGWTLTHSVGAAGGADGAGTGAGSAAPSCVGGTASGLGALVGDGSGVGVG